LWLLPIHSRDFSDGEMVEIYMKRYRK